MNEMIHTWHPSRRKVKAKGSGIPSLPGTQKKDYLKPHIHIYKYIYTHTYIYIHMHTHKPTQKYTNI